MTMDIEDRTIALAGIFQATTLVRQIARHGLVDQVPFDASINSLLEVDAPSTRAVYGELEGIEHGLHVLCRIMENTLYRGQDLEIMRYALGLMLLERKLIKRERMVQEIRQGIEAVIDQVDINLISHEEMIEQFAELYTQTISTFDYRIQVKGEPYHLKNELNVHRIRALLLAGIRSAVLWYQKGGNRLQLLFSRKKIAQVAQALLREI
ncbi:MAG: lysogenization regulator HflD [Beggiatoa sp. IS2]|nr:MAG: lysogenization regulator HflD [Beggiatoa sp. IS2]